jgi:hypothetical protein
MSLDLQRHDWAARAEIARAWIKEVMLIEYWDPATSLTDRRRVIDAYDLQGERIATLAGGASGSDPRTSDEIERARLLDALVETLQTMRRMVGGEPPDWTAEEREGWGYVCQALDSLSRLDGRMNP